MPKYLSASTAVEIDFKKYQAKKNGKSIYLTVLEFAILKFLTNHKEQVVSRNTILDEIWGEDVYVTSRTVDPHVAHLRKKIEDDPAIPKFVVGVRRGNGDKLISSFLLRIRQMFMNKTT